MPAPSPTVFPTRNRRLGGQKGGHRPGPSGPVLDRFGAVLRVRIEFCGSHRPELYTCTGMSILILRGIDIPKTQSFLTYLMQIPLRNARILVQKVGAQKSKKCKSDILEVYSSGRSR